MKTLTDKGIERLRRPEHGRRVLADKTCPGLQVRVSATGVKSWSVLYKVAGEGVTRRGTPRTGKQRRMSLGTWPAVSLEQARDAARNAKKLARKGIDPAKAAEAEAEEHRKAKANTVALVGDEFVREYAKPNVRSWKQLDGVLKHHVNPRWGKRPIAELRRRDVLALLAAVKANTGGGAAKNTLKLVRQLWGFAMERELVAANIAVGVKPPVKPKPRQRKLKADEIRLVWQGAAALGYPFGDYVKMLLLTACRRGEVARLRWGQIDLDHDIPHFVVPAEEYKSGVDHLVPLSTLAVQVLKALPRFGEGEDAGHFVFSTRAGETPISGFSKYTERLLAEMAKIDAAPLPGWTLHDLRRSAASGLSDLGVEPHVIDAVLGHVLPGLHRTYSVPNPWHYAPEKARALETWAGTLRQIVGENVVVFTRKAQDDAI